MRAIKTLSFALATLALTGCIATDLGTTPVSTRPSDIGPGPTPVDGIDASLMFTRICVDTQPNFAAAPGKLARLPFRQHPETGTYYHQTLNLAVKLVPEGGGACSMVFASHQSPAVLGSAIAASVGAEGVTTDPLTGATSGQLASGAVFRFRPAANNGGIAYYQAFLTAAP